MEALKEIMQDKEYKVEPRDNVPHDGSCQFGAVAESMNAANHPTGKGKRRLREIMPEDLRTKAVKFLREKGAHLVEGQFSCQQELEDYLLEMLKEDTWGDERTLHAMSAILRIQIHVISSQGDGYHKNFNYTNSEDAPVIHIGYLHAPPAHYVSMRPI